MERSTRRAPIKAAHRVNRAHQRDGHAGRAAWRSAPATEHQLRALRLIATVTGHTFRRDITRGESWRRIVNATSLLSPPTRRACAPPWWTASNGRRHPI